MNKLANRMHTLSQPSPLLKLVSKGMNAEGECMVTQERHSSYYEESLRFSEFSQGDEPGFNL